MKNPANMIKMMAFVNESRVLYSDLGRMPTADEMAKRLGISLRGAGILLDRAARPMGEGLDADFEHALAELPLPAQPGVPDDLLKNFDVDALERTIRSKLGENGG